MNGSRAEWCRLLGGCGVVVGLLLAVSTLVEAMEPGDVQSTTGPAVLGIGNSLHMSRVLPEAAPSDPTGSGPAELMVRGPASPVSAVVMSGTASLAPGLSGAIHRLVTRAEHSLRRLGGHFGHVVSLWVSVLSSTLVFLLITAVLSTADLRMFDPRQGLGVMSRYIGNGIRMFFRILRDRRMPYLPRVLIMVGLVYWLVPRDIIVDDSLLPGFVDDLLIAAAAAKGFIYLCPDSIVALHATALQLPA